MLPSLGNRLIELARIPHGVTVLNVQGDYTVEHLDFADETFDAVLCAHPLFSDWPDVPSGLREWRRVAKIGGTVGFIGYGENAFQPLAALFEARIQRYGIEFAVPIPSWPWRRLRDAVRETHTIAAQSVAPPVAAVWRSALTVFVLRAPAILLITCVCIVGPVHRRGAWPRHVYVHERPTHYVRGHHHAA